MDTFYFTYGLEGQPFIGGWTEIDAQDMETAVKAFRAFHPDKIEGILNCSSVYTKEQFNGTIMQGERGNFGRRCVEKIKIERTLPDE